MKRLSFLICVLCVACLLSSCSESYYEKTGWNCDNETFINTYVPLYEAKIEELKNELNLDFEERIDYSTDENGSVDGFEWFLYTSEYTILFNAYNREFSFGSAGHCDISLYYYGKDGEFGDYEEYKPLVCFIDELTDYVAYDAKTEGNYFEVIHNEALSDEKGSFADYYHHDSLIGNVMYGVSFNAEAGYYYMAAYDGTLEKNCYRFIFEGLLKPLI